MTASKTWALLVGLLLVGAGVIGAALWRSHLVSVVEMAKRDLTPAPQPPRPNLAKPEVSTLAKPPPSSTASTPAPSSMGAPPPKPKPAEPPSGHGEPPHFDVVRVEPSGDAVLAGKGEPNAEVALTEGGTVVAEAKADSSGNFVILPPALKPGAHDLSLRQSVDGKAETQSQQTVAVSVPPTPHGDVVVALAEPGKPTRVLSKPPAPPAALANAPAPPTPPQTAAAPAAAAPRPGHPDSVAALPKPQTAVAPPPGVAPRGPDLAIRTAELENGNGFYVTGTAAPQTQVEIYLNGAHLASVVAGADGQWSVTVRKGLTGGHYSVRADALGPDRKVAARAEVPFDVPVTMAEAPPKPAPTSPPTKIVPPAEATTTPEPGDIASRAEAPAPPAAPTPSEAAVAPVDERPAEAPLPRPDVAAAGAKAAETKAAALPPAAAPAASPAIPEAASPAPSSRAAAAPPAVPAPTTVAPQASSPAPATPSANAVIDQVETALVVRGDNLWNISRTRLGYGRRYTQIYAANVSQIRNPKLIYPGQVFVMPHD